MERLRSMVKSRKLALVLDLDHTLLHTTMPRSPAQVSILQRICGISDEVFQVMFPHPLMDTHVGRGSGVVMLVDYNVHGSYT